MNPQAPRESLCMPNEEAAALISSLLSDGASVRIRVYGRSMEPAICSGDVVVIVPMAGRIRWGDIVLCRRGGELANCFIHRMVWRSGRDTWRTKGDALKSLDPGVTRADIIGRVRSIERAGDAERSIRLEGLPARLTAIGCALRSLAAATLARCRRP